MGAALKDDCPRADPAAGLEVQTLHHACVKLGGLRQLAERLRVTPVTVIRWLDGDLPVPKPTFLDCVDVLYGPAERRTSPERPVSFERRRPSA
jgi:hypothetical protein